MASPANSSPKALAHEKGANFGGNTSTASQMTKSLDALRRKWKDEDEPDHNDEATELLNHASHEVIGISNVV